MFFTFVCIYIREARKIGVISHILDKIGDEARGRETCFPSGEMEWITYTQLIQLINDGKLIQLINTTYTKTIILRYSTIITINILRIPTYKTPSRPPRGKHPVSSFVFCINYADARKADLSQADLTMMNTHTKCTNWV